MATSVKEMLDKFRAGDANAFSAYQSYLVKRYNITEAYVTTEMLRPLTLYELSKSDVTKKDYENLIALQYLMEHVNINEQAALYGQLVEFIKQFLVQNAEIKSALINVQLQDFEDSRAFIDEINKKVDEVKGYDKREFNDLNGMQRVDKIKLKIEVEAQQKSLNKVLEEDANNFYDFTVKYLYATKAPSVMVGEIVARYSTEKSAQKNIISNYSANQEALDHLKELCPKDKETTFYRDLEQTLKIIDEHISLIDKCRKKTEEPAYGEGRYKALTQFKSLLKKPSSEVTALKSQVSEIYKVLDDPKNKPRKRELDTLTRICLWFRNCVPKKYQIRSDHQRSYQLLTEMNVFSKDSLEKKNNTIKNAQARVFPIIQNKIIFKADPKEPFDAVGDIFVEGYIQKDSPLVDFLRVLLFVDKSSFRTFYEELKNDRESLREVKSTLEKINNTQTEIGILKPGKVDVELALVESRLKKLEADAARYFPFKGQ